MGWKDASKWFHYVNMVTRYVLIGYPLSTTRWGFGSAGYG